MNKYKITFHIGSEKRVTTIQEANEAYAIMVVLEHYISCGENVTKISAKPLTSDG
jgi:hypothetical protein